MPLGECCWFQRDEGWIGREEGVRVGGRKRDEPWDGRRVGVDSVPDVPPPWEAFVPVNIGDGEGIGIGEMELIGESFMRLGFADLIYLIHQTD
jgi:hypothetical protein